MDAPNISAVFAALAAQLPMLLVQLGVTVGLLVMLLVQGPKLGRARVPALVGASILVALALVTQPLYAIIPVYSLASHMTTDTVAVIYAVVGIASTVLHGIAILLLGVAIIRR